MSEYGLAPRPELGPEEWAALVVALESLREEPATAPAPEPVSSWRFSGRWFQSGPFDQRRPRRVT